MARTGRPKTEHAKDTKIGFRITQEERAKLDEYCEKKGMTQTQVLYEALEQFYKINQ